MFFKKGNFMFLRSISSHKLKYLVIMIGFTVIYIAGNGVINVINGLISNDKIAVLIELLYDYFYYCLNPYRKIIGYYFNLKDSHILIPDKVWSCRVNSIFYKTNTLVKPSVADIR